MSRTLQTHSALLCLLPLQKMGDIQFYTVVAGQVIRKRLHLQRILGWLSETR